MATDPSLNVTVPVAVGGVTVAVRATTCPVVAGLGEITRLVALVPCPIATPTADDRLGLKLPSPMYEAVTE